MDGVASPPPKRQRASRKGQPRRFECTYPGCQKRYSRAEHLARHRLNHDAKVVYRCDVEGCSHQFVRLDLYARHKRKHDESILDEQNGLDSVSPRNNQANGSVSRPYRNEESSTPALESTTMFSQAFNLDGRAKAGATTPQLAASIEGRWRQGAHVQVPESSMGDGLPSNSARPTVNSNLVTDFQAHLNPAGIAQLQNAFNNDQSNDTFAAWLFDSPGSHNSGFDFNNMPFLDFGMDFGSNDILNFDDYSTGFGQTIGARTYSSASTASDQRPGREPHLYISEERRVAIIELLSMFMGKKPLPSNVVTQPESILFGNHLDWPNLTTIVLERCIAAFWSDLAAQMPIAHQPTFSANRCQLYLVLSIIALGAAAIVRSQPKSLHEDYRAFGDFIATNLRWEIFTHSHAEPPVHLWVAQALLFLEFYEKLFSTRQLHERANIHHASTLTLLRRGNPMVGRSGSETPPSELPTRRTTPVPGSPQAEPKGHEEGHAWWKRWVSNESMNRVVFAAFQMDTLHACMFGHSADLLPHELRLPLPCDDSLWTAKNGEEVRRLESTFAMYGIKSVNFLDGLKRCLHGYEVKTHRLGREILIAGLLSVGWHINRREKNLQFVETTPSVQEQARWRSLLLLAFGHWRRSFEEVVGRNGHSMNANTTTQDAADPTVLFHFAHLTMHVDIIDCQILSGTRRLMGRRVSDKDRAAVAERMKAWANSAQAGQATLHAFRLLQATLCKGSNGRTITYTCRNDPFIYRPWILYLASLTLWAYQYAAAPAYPSRQRQQSTNQELLSHSPFKYISACAAIDNPENIASLVSKAGCIAVLQTLAQDFANAESEILMEAAKRLQEGIKILLESG